MTTLRRAIAVLCVLAMAFAAWWPTHHRVVELSHVDAGVAVRPLAPQLPPGHAPAFLAQRAAARPRPVDTRTPAQVTQDACGGDGHFCTGTSIKHTMAAGLGATPCTACAVSAWYGDELGIVLNTSGQPCASDSNNGTSATCGAAGSGIGPLLHLPEITRRWGTETPELDQITTITCLSWCPSPWNVHAHGNAALVVQGVLGTGQQYQPPSGPPISWPVTLSGFTTYNYVAGTLSTMPAFSGVMSGYPSTFLIYNQTKSSFAWVAKATGGSTGTQATTMYLSAQMTAALTPPYSIIINGNGAGGFATWANGDQLVAYYPPCVGLQSGGYRVFSPTVYFQGLEADPPVYGSGFTLINAGTCEPNFIGPGFNPYGYMSTSWDPGSAIVQSVLYGPADLANGTFGGDVPTIDLNSFIEGTVTTGSSFTSEFFGGVVGKFLASACVLGGDLVISYTGGFLGPTQLGNFNGLGGVYTEQVQEYSTVATVNGQLWGSGEEVFDMGTGVNAPHATLYLLTRILTLDGEYAQVPWTTGEVALQPNNATPNLLGTFSLTNGSPTVTASLAQDSSLADSDYIIFSAQQTTVYQISTIAGTALTLTANYTGPTSPTAVGSSSRLDRQATSGGFAVGGSFSAITPRTIGINNGAYH